MENDYSNIIGRKFKPSFSSNIDYFEIRGYDEKRKMVLTIAHPKEGSPFDDEIEEQYLVAAFENGDYRVCDRPFNDGQEPTYVITNPREYLDYPRAEKKVAFDGPCCARCIHRFGRTSNSEWCKSHFQSERCYRFKLK